MALYGVMAKTFKIKDTSSMTACETKAKPLGLHLVGRLVMGL